MDRVDSWPAIRTFHHRQFADTAVLLHRKQAQGVRLSLCIPTLDEEPTIASVVGRLRPLRDQVPLLDEIAVIDSGSRDRTLERAAAAGADVYLAADILPELGHCVGKGENLWKAVYQLRGDIVVFIDGDITNIHPGFVTGLIGPLLSHSGIGYVKAFYDRPSNDASDRGDWCGGGRLTEILVRPLLSFWYPELAGLIQPLAGEYAARRSLLERLSFPVGYGVELAHLLDLHASHGLGVFAQTDMEERCHRHRDNRQLGQSAHALLQVLHRRLQRQGILDRLPREAPALRQFVRCNGQCRSQEIHIAEQERPPWVQVEGYRTHHSTVVAAAGGRP